MVSRDLYGHPKSALMEAQGASNDQLNLPNLLSWRRLYLSRAKLKATSRTSALLSGFAMVGMVELSINDKIDKQLLVAYAVLTMLLVSVHLLALMISTCILPYLEAVSSTMSNIEDSPHDKMHCYIEMAWALSTGFGILLFLAEIAMLCWVKFDSLPGEIQDDAQNNVNTTIAAPSSGRDAAIVSTAIVVPVCIVFVVFALNFYRKLVNHKYERTNRNLEELEHIHSGLHNL